MEVDGDGEQTVGFPFGHGSDELADVTIGVPLAGVRIGPARGGFGIQVVVGCLDHARVEEEAFNAVTVPGAARVGGLAVEVEVLADDGDVGLFGRGRVEGSSDEVSEE